MLLREVAAREAIELMNLKSGVDEDVLAQMIEDNNMFLSYKGKPLSKLIFDLSKLVRQRVFDTKNPRFFEVDLDRMKVLYAPREKIIYVRFAFKISVGMSTDLKAYWVEYKVPPSLQAKETAIGTMKLVANDQDTFNLTSFVYKKKP